MSESCRRCQGSGLEPWALETGEADFSALLAESGLDFEWVATSGQTETWDWIRSAPVQRIDGSWAVDTYKPSGFIAAAVSVSLAQPSPFTPY